MTKKAFRNYHKFHGLGGDGFTKDTRTSEDIWDSWNRNFGEFTNLQGVRQSIWEITEAVRTGRAEGNPANLYDCSHRFGHHAEEQTQLAKDAGTLSNLLQGVWTGDAAAVARSRFDEFVTAAGKTAEVLDTNATNLDGQAEQFRTLSERMQPMPPLEQTRQELFSQHRWTCDSVWAWQDPYNEAATVNKQLYDEYHLATQQNIGQVEADYGTVQPLTADTEVALPPAGTALPDGSNTGSNTGYDTDYDTGSAGLGGAGYTPNDTTRAASSVPLGEGAIGAGALGGGGLGGGAGGGPGSSGSGVGALGAGALGAGAAGAGGAGAPGRLGGGLPAGGAGARGGAGGMTGGGAGGGGRGGKEGEDEEYRSKGWLNEDDPNSLFGLEEPLVPPVIGAD